MSGSHLKAGQSRFAWEVLRFVLGWALVVTLVVTLFWLLQEVLPAVVGETTTPTTIEQADTTTTTEPPVTTTTTTTEPPVTTTTAAPTTSTTTTLAPVRPPEEVTVLVLNSTPRVGLAASAAADLAQLGYQVVVPANATPRRPVTVILHAEGYGLEAIEMATHFEAAATVRPDDEGRTTTGVPIVVILGDSFSP